MAALGLCMVRNGADVVAPVVRHMARQLDRVVVMNNLSDDGTDEILADLADELANVEWSDDVDPAHRQSAKMSAWADELRLETGADWLVPFDVDEVWYSPFGRIADILDELPAHVFTATALLYDHVATSADPAEPDPTLRLGWRRRDPGPFPKVACRLAPGLTVEEGNHGAHYGDGRWPDPVSVDRRLIVRHFPYRSAEQMAEKARIGAAALRAAGLPEHIGQHWHDYDRLGPDLLREVFAEHFYADRPDRRSDLIYDPAPVSR